MAVAVSVQVEKSAVAACVGVAKWRLGPVAVAVVGDEANSFVQILKKMEKLEFRKPFHHRSRNAATK
jgi:hypothetical protein